MEGEFSYKTAKYFENRSVQYQDYYGREISLSFNSYFDGIQEIPKLPYNLEISKYIKCSKERKAIRQNFGTYISSEIEKNDSIAPLMQPGRSIVLSEYEPFSSVEEFFKNVVAPLKVQKKKGAYVYRMVNPKNKPFFEGSPLFIIDQYIVRDPEYFAAMDINTIEKIELYYDQDELRRLFGYLGKGGIVAVYTKEGMHVLPDEFMRNMFSIPGVQKTQVFSTDDSKKSPDFRPTVYWNSNVELDENGSATIEFVHSDDRSDFQIEIVGVTSEGEVFTKKQYYSVR